ncbi:hypothetical protein HY383_03505 [Candidatus Daviesbacteria bacterium]|nr:hypothetical protein [Candidatus Daviesbacteria bacterium]
MPKNRLESQEGFIVFVLVIVFLIIGIAATGFFILKNYNGQKKTTGTFVKANSPIQNTQKIPINPQSAGGSLPEMSRGYSPASTAKSVSTSIQTGVAITPVPSSQPKASSSSVIPTPVPAQIQIPQSGDKSPTTFN